MKRTERHHLKENPVLLLAMQARDLFEARKRETGAVAVGVAIVAMIAIGYFAWHERVQTRARTLLAEALTTQVAKLDVAGTKPTPGGYPNEHARLLAAVTKFKAAADAYPSTDAGIFARYQEAVSRLALGDAAAAAAAYQQVVDRSGDGIYGQMARLGLAEAQAQAGKFDDAINTFKELAQRKDGPLPIDGVLMQLGRTYRDAGKRADAQQTFNRLVSEYPDSPFTTEAKRELDSLNKT